MSTAPQSSDPFALAYARDRGMSAAEQAAQLVARGQAKAERKDKYAGYGVPDPGAPCGPQSPADALAECIRAGREVLAGTIQLHELVPWTEPPYRAIPQNTFVQAVLSTTVGFNAAVNAAGLAMQAANTVGTNAPVLLEQSSATDWKTLSMDPTKATAQATQTHMMRIKTWGISFGAAGPKAAKIRTRAATVGGSPPPPNPFVSSYQADQQEDTFVILQPDQALNVDVQLEVVVAPVLIYFALIGWSWPVKNRKDKPEGAILRSGYGLECDQ